MSAEPPLRSRARHERERGRRTEPTNTRAETPDEIPGQISVFDALTTLTDTAEQHQEATDEQD